jgi:mono/diheme cytochrome c family protein
MRCGLNRLHAQSKAMLAAMLSAFGLVASAGAQGLQDDAALVARGAYLARAADCAPCHTGNASQPFAGGLGLKTPFGTLFSVNITSDPETGIGKWTFDQFKNALHRGIRADGAYLYPGMPFDAFTKIEEDDLEALWAYVRGIPPVKAPNPQNQLSFPFDVRLGMLAWRELFFSPGYFKPAAGKSAEWNRGAYLVEALAHCSDCHSPRNIMGAIKGKALFTGTEVDGFYAPDIASGALAKTWTRDNLMQFLKTGASPQRGSVFGPMADVVHDSLSYLTDPDIAAIVTYLFDSPPPPDLPAPQTLSPLAPDVYRQSARLYIDNCATCHQPHGTGTAGAVPPLRGNPAVTALDPYNVITVVLEGLPKGGQYGVMPSFAGRLSDAQIADLANYVRTSWGNQAAANASAAMVAAWRATVEVPDFGTQAASAFDCPQVGGAPGAAGPRPAAVATLTTMLQGGNRNLPELIAAYQRMAPGAGPAATVNAMVSAYCPVVAASRATTYRKYAELRRFSLEAAAAVSPQAAAVSFPPADVIWATPAGRSFVTRLPGPFAGKITCPASDGTLVPSDLVAKAAAVLDKPKLPVGGVATVTLATRLATQNPKAAPVDLANALIAAYCPDVAADASVDPAERFSWLEGFGEQVIQTLQLRTMAATAEPTTPPAAGPQSGADKPVAAERTRHRVHHTSRTEQHRRHTRASQDRAVPGASRRSGIGTAGLPAGRWAATIGATDQAQRCRARSSRNDTAAQRTAARTEAAVWPNRIARSSAVRMPPWLGLTSLTRA